MDSSAPGRAALGHIDHVLASRPARDGMALSHATACLGQFRDGLVAERREGGLGPDRGKCLSHVNAVITVVLAIHFPLGDPPWPELEEARAWLAEAIDLAGSAA